MKVRFINSDNLFRNSKLLYPPLGLLRISTVLKMAGYSVQLIDLAAERLDISHVNLISAGIHDEPVLLGFNTSSNTLPYVLSLAEKVKQALPQSFIVLGGPQATLTGEKIMEVYDFVDVIVVGEGEETTLELVRALEKGLTLSKLSGIIYRSDEKVIKNLPRLLISDLDSLPIPDYSLLTDNYHPEQFYLNAVEAGRGCPNNCSFCCSSIIWQHKYRLRSSRSVIQEMDYLSKRFSINFFNLIHDNLLAYPSKGEEFLNALIADKNRYRWACYARPDMINELLAEKLEKAGCVKILFGIESGSKRMQRNINKSININLASEGIKHCREKGIGLSLSFIVGFPREEWVDLENTLRKALEYQALGQGMHFLEIQFSNLIIYPETKLYKDCSHRLVYDKDHARESCSSSQFPLSQKYLKNIKQYPQIYSATLRLPINSLGTRFKRVLKAYHGLFCYFPKVPGLPLKN